MVQYWQALGNKSGMVRTTKVKAHSTKEDVLSGAVTWQDYAGNALADAYADSAADKASVPQSVLAGFDVVDTAALKVQRRLVAIVCAAPTRQHDERDTRAYKQSFAESRELPEASSAPPEAPENQELASVVAVQGPEPSPPPPSPPVEGPLRYQVGGDRSVGLHWTHRLVCRQGLWWCTTCGCHATSRGRGLLLPCLYRATRAGKQALDRLANGLTPHNSVEWPLPL